MKIKLFFLSIILVLAACKKDAKPPVVLQTPPIDITGTWTVYSSNNSLFSIGEVTADQYPCIAENTITFNSDLTYTTKYTGTSTCVLTGGVTFGDPSDAPVNGTWKRNGNNIKVGPYYEVVSNTNGKIIMTEKDTVQFQGKTYYATVVSYKK